MYDLGRPPQHSHGARSSTRREWCDGHSCAPRAASRTPRKVRVEAHTSTAPEIDHRASEDHDRLTAPRRTRRPARRLLTRGVLNTRPLSSLKVRPRKLTSLRHFPFVATPALSMRLPLPAKAATLTSHKGSTSESFCRGIDALDGVPASSQSGTTCGRSAHASWAAG